MALRCQCWANALAACVAPAYPDDEPDDEPTDEELAQMRREQMEQEALIQQELLHQQHMLREQLEMMQLLSAPSSPRSGKQARRDDCPGVLAKGCRVRIDDLVNAEHHNGKEAVCIAVHQESGRCAVELDSGETLSVHTRNLCLVGAAEAAAHSDALPSASGPQSQGACDHLGFPRGSVDADPPGGPHSPPTTDANNTVASSSTTTANASLRSTQASVQDEDDDLADRHQELEDIVEESMSMLDEEEMEDQAHRLEQMEMEASLFQEKRRLIEQQAAQAPVIAVRSVSRGLTSRRKKKDDVPTKGPTLWEPTGPLFPQKKDSCDSCQNAFSSRSEEAFAADAEFTFSPVDTIGRGPDVGKGTDTKVTKVADHDTAVARQHLSDSPEVEDSAAQSSGPSSPRSNPKCGESCSKEASTERDGEQRRDETTEQSTAFAALAKLEDEVAMLEEGAGRDSEEVKAIDHYALSKLEEEVARLNQRLEREWPAQKSTAAVEDQPRGTSISSAIPEHRQLAGAGEAAPVMQWQPGSGEDDAGLVEENSVMQWHPGLEPAGRNEDPVPTLFVESQGHEPKGRIPSLQLSSDEYDDLVDMFDEVP